MSVRPIFVISILVLILASPLHAQETTKKFSGEISVTATGTEEDASKVPAAVTVISSDEIEESQVSDLSTLLRRVPGITVMASGGTGNQSSVFTRGTESDHTLVMIDGVRLNSPYFGGFDFSQLSTAGLERVEVLRGPSSALWGSDAIGGVVNLVPQRATNGLHGHIMAEQGSDSWERDEGGFSYALKKFDLFASGLKHSGDSGLENSDFDLETEMVDTGWNFENSRIGILFFRNDSTLGIPFSSPGSLTPLRRQKNRQTTTALPFTWTINESWSLESTISQVSNEFRFSDPDDPWGYTSQATDADTTQARAVLHSKQGSHRLSLGGEWRSDEVDDSSSYGVNLDGERNDSSGFFFQDDWNINTSTRLLASLRWDTTDEWGSELSPRLGVSWNLGKDYGLRINYGEAFRQPSIGELYFPGIGNSELDPETSTSWEVGFSRDLESSWESRFELNFYHTEIDDLINLDYLSYTMENIGKATIDGAEFIVNAQLGDDLSSSLEINWLDAEDGENQDLLRRPEWSGSVNIHGSLFKGCQGDFSLLYVGVRPDIDATTFARVESPGFVTVDLALGFPMTENIKLQIRGQNLLGRDYAEINGYPAPGRRMMAGFRADF